MLKCLVPGLGVGDGICYQFQGLERETWIAISEEQLLLEHITKISDRE